MALALLLQQRQGKNSKPGKEENFGCKFKANFILESSTIKPFGKLSGQLVIESPAPILHYGIRVQLEAICTLKFETKLDNRVRYHCKCGNLLEGSSDKEMVDGYMQSPVMIDLEPVIIKGKKSLTLQNQREKLKLPFHHDMHTAESSENRPYELQAGTNTYGFNIAIPGEVLPAPFKSAYGSLVYKLGAYMRAESGVIVQIGEKVLKFGGYYNLSKNADAAKAVTIERSVKRSLFTGKKLLMVTLKLESCGFLPEDLLRFSMRVQNPKCLPYKMSVQLIQKVIYSVSGTKKTTVAIVGSAEKEVDEPESETVWDGSFKVHKGVSPTYVGRNQMYQVSHVVQLKVKLDDYNAMKAEKAVYVGTTRETVESLVAAFNNGNLSNNGNTANERRSSIASVQSNSSSANTNTTIAKPSILSKRISSEALLPENEVVASSSTSMKTLKRPILENPEDENVNEIGAAAVLLSSR